MNGIESFSVQGRTAVITGGNTGIGLGIARGLARAGARVAICGRDAAKNAVALDELEKIRPGGCAALAFDLSAIDRIPSFWESVIERVGTPDILVNNAGITFRARADELPPEDFARVLCVNLTAPFALSQCFARTCMESRRPGAIIFIASLMSEASRPTTAAYTASKGGVRQLVKALAVDWAPFGIRVNGIGPGYIQTEMTRSLVENADFDAWVKKRTPLGRWGQPDDFEGAAVFLASDAARFVTGQILYVDGGWLATF